MDIKELVLNLCDRDGVTGDETRLGVEPLLEKFAEVSRTPVGSLIGLRGSEGNTILLDAHADRIGLIVTGITDEGFLRVGRVGGMDRRVLAASQVTVRGRENVPGVITSIPPHLTKDEDKTKAPDFDSIFVDVGMTKEEAEKLIRPGDAITVDGKGVMLSETRVTGAALDDRAGIAAILRALEIIEESASKRRVAALFSAQEETSGIGAKTGAYDSEPHEAIAVDVSFAKQNGVEAHESGELGKGPMICFSPSLSREMSQKLVELAEANKIPYQIEVSPGRTSTNADDIAASRAGVRTALVSIPQRSMHTQAEVCDLNDIENTARLLAAYVTGGAV